ncbi:ABC transporter ATP-binding protein [Methyloversatilis sp.]|uniref:ABC transporter ATP-binding protein n=1 Tax=Methyloversatilis sp. TaxID=2569862 RepID=UPI003F6FC5AB
MSRIMPMRGRVEVTGVDIHFGRGDARFKAVSEVSFSVPAGQFLCLLGPSGCGKSTVLGALAGHIRPSAGSLTLDAQPIEGPAPERGLVFQHHTLFPWKSVIDNVAFGLKMQGISRSERTARARELIELVGLKGFERHYPVQLSGGMQQRVEIARVLINQPRVLLMDEPFGALDAQTRQLMQQLLLDVWARVGTTIVFVTHDIDEALFLGDRILVMGARPGRLIDDIPVRFARPRDRTLTTTVSFNALKRHCQDLLHPDHAGAARPRLSPLDTDADFSVAHFAI